MAKIPRPPRRLSLNLGNCSVSKAPDRKTNTAPSQEDWSRLFVALHTVEIRCGTGGQNEQEGGFAIPKKG